jgi:hypothetical protein
MKEHCIDPAGATANCSHPATLLSHLFNAKHLPRFTGIKWYGYMLISLSSIHYAPNPNSLRHCLLQGLGNNTSPTELHLILSFLSAAFSSAFRQDDKAQGWVCNRYTGRQRRVEQHGRCRAASAAARSRRCAAGADVDQAKRQIPTAAHALRQLRPEDAGAAAGVTGGGTWGGAGRHGVEVMAS